MSEAELLVSKTGEVGRLTLNRPQALNALTYDMVLEIEKTLDAWADDPEIAMVVLDGSGERALCAGGDIADLYKTGSSGDFAFGRRFWRDEYRLNAKIARSAKPYVAIMDGVTMGGGVGVSAHGSHRVVTERSKIAMPECGIGLVPDVGGSFVLSNAPGRTGEYLAATGYRMGAADAIFSGFADAYVPGERRAALTEALLASGDPVAINAFGLPPDAAPLAAIQDKLEQHFDFTTAAECVASLEDEGSDWAEKTARAMRAASPISIAVAHAMIRRLRDVDTIEDALALEYRFTWRSMTDGDFLEGIRALIIDKDKQPKWRIGQLEDVSVDLVESLLAPLGGDELKL